MRNSWETISESYRIPLPVFYYFELIREVLANTLYFSGINPVMFFERDVWLDLSGPVSFGLFSPCGGEKFPKPCESACPLEHPKPRKFKVAQK